MANTDGASCMRRRSARRRLLATATTGRRWPLPPATGDGHASSRRPRGCPAGAAGRRGRAPDEQLAVEQGVATAPPRGPRTASTESSPSSTMGWATVVRAGAVYSASSMSSMPTTDSCSGTDQPASVRGTKRGDGGEVVVGDHRHRRLRDRSRSAVDDGLPAVERRLGLQHRLRPQAGPIEGLPEPEEAQHARPGGQAGEEDEAAVPEADQVLRGDLARRRVVEADMGARGRRQAGGGSRSGRGSDRSATRSTSLGRDADVPVDDDERHAEPHREAHRFVVTDRRDRDDAVHPLIEEDLERLALACASTWDMASRTWCSRSRARSSMPGTTSPE